MGQGLNTKMIQVASRALEIPVSKIHIQETSTDIIANATPTGGSVGTELHGASVLNACQILSERLLPYKNAGSASFLTQMQDPLQDPAGSVHLAVSQIMHFA